MLDDDVVAAAFSPRQDGIPVPAAVSAAGPARRLRDAAEPVASHPVWSRRVDEAVADRLLEVAAGLDAHGRPLFAGLRGRALPDDPHGRLQRGCELLHEHRGDGHVAVVVAAGLSAVDTDVLTELWTGTELGSSTRGWSPEQQASAVASLEARGWLAGGRLAAAGAASRADLEERTDATAQAVVDALGPDLDGVVTQLDAWGARVIEAGGFPADALERVAG